MRIGTPMIKRCQECGQYFEQPTLVSCNTIGAKFWTDGKLEAPMWLDIPEFVKCPHCSALLWLSEQPELDQDRSLFSRFKKTIHYERYLQAGRADYETALKCGEENLCGECYLRTRLWWAGNDRRRGKETMLPLSTNEAENLLALGALLTLANPEDRNVAAEIKRELGHFRQAENLLVDMLGGEYANAAMAIANLADKRDSFVNEVELR